MKTKGQTDTTSWQRQEKKKGRQNTLILFTAIVVLLIQYSFLPVCTTILRVRKCDEWLSLNVRKYFLNCAKMHLDRFFFKCYFLKKDYFCGCSLSECEPDAKRKPKLWRNVPVERCKNVRPWRAGVHPLLCMQIEHRHLSETSEVLSEAWQSTSQAGPLRCLSFRLSENGSKLRSRNDKHCSV